MRRLTVLTFGCLLLGVLSGCSVTRHLDKEEYLLRRSSIKLKTPLSLSEKSILADQLSTLQLQKPNTYLFGLFPYKVWLYNLRYKRYQKDTVNFQITSRTVEKPVVFDTSQMHQTSDHIFKYLQNQGFFYASVLDTVKYKRRRAFVQYDVKTKYRYRIDSVTFKVMNAEMTSLAPAFKNETLLKHGSFYNNVLAGEERNRIVDVARNNGYYNFSVDNVSFLLDTLQHKKVFHLGLNPFENAINFMLQGTKSKQSHIMNIEVIIHQTKDSLAFRQYRFHKVVVFPDYLDTLKVDTANYHRLLFNGISFRYRKKQIHEEVIDRKIFIRPGDLYAQNKYNETLRQLNNLGIFQFVRIYIFPDRKDSTHHLLNCYIVAKPNDKFNFQTNVEASGGDLYVIGSAANVSLTDNNFLKGANQLTATLSYGLEMGQNKLEDVPFFKQFYVFSRNVGFNFKLTFPKFLLPVSQQKFSRKTLPKTFINAGINSMNRIDFFSLRSINGSFGYAWRESPTKSWVVKPAFVNILHLTRIDPAFQARMDSVAAIRHSYQETFVEGEEVNFVRNTTGIRKNQSMYMKLGFEESGALVSGIKGLVGIFGKTPSFKNAHYVRLNFDVRQYFLQNASSLIFRFAGGIGIPYDGSSVLPYIKQYFVGGAYSIRGWRPRVLGPGSYKAITNDPRDNLLVDESGDIKLEANAEYRFNMIKLFSGEININGAVFADAGNIWLARKDPNLPGANFEFNTLYQDVALSTGAGLRLDLGGFLVLRFDWAFPLKKPYVMDNYGWVLKQIDFGSKQWRKENINLNIAIGYPF